MQEQQAKSPEQQAPLHPPAQLPNDATDCMQCLIIMYGETHIDNLAQLLNLTANAETSYSKLCIRRLC